jgi:hypothetical protein
VGREGWAQGDRDEEVGLTRQCLGGVSVWRSGPVESVGDIMPSLQVGSLSRGRLLKSEGSCKYCGSHMSVNRMLGGSLVVLDIGGDTRAVV